MKLSHATLYEWRGDMSKKLSVAADKSGKFTLKTDKTGMYSLQLSGVDHQSYSIEPLLLDKPKKITVSGTLKAFPYQGFDEVKIVTSLNGMNWEEAVAMNRNPDGTFSAEFEVPGTEFSYQLLNVVEDRSVNGTQADRYENDGSGDYLSFIAPKNGKVSVIFDPSRLIRSDAEAKVSHDDNVTKNFVATQRSIQETRGQYWSALSSHKKSGLPNEEFRFDISAKAEEIRSKIGSEKNPFLKQLLYFEYLTLADYDKSGSAYDRELVKQAVAALPASSWVWVLQPYLVAELPRIAAVENNAIAEKIIGEHPSLSLRRTVLSALMERAFYAKDEETGLRYFRRLIAEHPESWEAKRARNEFDPNRNIQKGKIIPALDITSIDGRETFTIESLRGKVWLIDFWATWCGPCMMEMPELHKAYNTFKDRGFEILSLSFDRSPDDVTNLREKGKFPMPWKHAFVEKGFNNELSARYEVSGIPKPILVDAEGRILAYGSELRGERLAATLETFLPGAAKALDEQ